MDQSPDPIEQELPDLYPPCAITRAMAKKVMLTSASNHFPSSLVEEDNDIRSRSQLSEEQLKDPEISPLFQKSQ